MYQDTTKTWCEPGTDQAVAQVHRSTKHHGSAATRMATTSMADFKDDGHDTAQHYPLPPADEQPPEVQRDERLIELLSTYEARRDYPRGGYRRADLTELSRILNSEVPDDEGTRPGPVPRTKCIFGDASRT